MNFLDKLTEATQTVVESKVTDYIDSDRLGEILTTNPILSKYKDCEILDGMILKMIGDMGDAYYKIIKNDDGDFEAYWVSKDGEKLGDAFLLESDDTDEPEVICKVYITYQVGPGVYQSEEYGDVFYDVEQASDKVAELRAQGLHASYEIIFPKEDPDYDKNADETNWSTEEEADADKRFENRYMNGGNGATFKEDEDFPNPTYGDDIDKIMSRYTHSDVEEIYPDEDAKRQAVNHLKHVINVIDDEGSIDQDMMLYNVNAAIECLAGPEYDDVLTNLEEIGNTIEEEGSIDQNKVYSIIEDCLDMLDSFDDKELILKDNDEPKSDEDWKNIAKGIAKEEDDYNERVDKFLDDAYSKLQDVFGKTVSKITPESRKTYGISVTDGYTVLTSKSLIGFLDEIEKCLDITLEFQVKGGSWTSYDYVTSDGIKVKAGETNDYMTYYVGCSKRDRVDRSKLGEDDNSDNDLKESEDELRSLLRARIDKDFEQFKKDHPGKSDYFMRTEYDATPIVDAFNDEYNTQFSWMMGEDPWRLPVPKVIVKTPERMQEILDTLNSTGEAITPAGNNIIKRGNMVRRANAYDFNNDECRDFTLTTDINDFIKWVDEIDKIPKHIDRS